MFSPLYTQLNVIDLTLLNVHLITVEPLLPGLTLVNCLPSYADELVPSVHEPDCTDHVIVGCGTDDEAYAT